MKNFKRKKLKFDYVTSIGPRVRRAQANASPRVSSPSPLPLHLHLSPPLPLISLTHCTEQTHTKKTRSNKTYTGLTKQFILALPVSHYEPFCVYLVQLEPPAAQLHLFDPCSEQTHLSAQEHSDQATGTHHDLNGERKHIFSQKTEMWHWTKTHVAQCFTFSNVLPSVQISPQFTLGSFPSTLSCSSPRFCKHTSPQLLGRHCTHR